MNRVEELSHYIAVRLQNLRSFRKAATALDAVRHGLSVTIIEDCVGYINDECHTEAMRQMADGMGAEGVELQELVDDTLPGANGLPHSPGGGWVACPRF